MLPIRLDRFRVLALLSCLILLGCPTNQQSQTISNDGASPVDQSLGSVDIEQVGNRVDNHQNIEVQAFIRNFRENLRRLRRVNTEDYQRLVKLVDDYPANHEVQRLMTEALVIRQDWDGMVEHYLTQSPERRDHDQLAGAYINSHRYTEAWQYLKEVVESLGSSPNRTWLMAVAAINAGYDDDAGRLLDEVIADNFHKRRAEAFFLRGQLYHRQANWPQAELFFRQALELIPKHVGLNVIYGQTLRHLGREDEAVRFEEIARQLQIEVDRLDATQRLMAALGNNLERAWAENDLDRCLKIIAQLEPHADVSVQKVLDEYRREIARLKGQ